MRTTTDKYVLASWHPLLDRTVRDLTKCLNAGAQKIDRPSTLEKTVVILKKISSGLRINLNVWDH